MSSVLGSLVADIALYPMETVLHRLHLQGSRTIIDNLDTGFEVVPVITRYEGFFDCCDSIRAEEGFGGFYRGFGALILQYAVRLSAIQLCTLVAREFANLINGNATIEVKNVGNQQQSQGTVPRDQEKEETPSQIENHYHTSQAGPGDSFSGYVRNRQHEILPSSYGGYIPASAFTEENDPYKHVRHAM